MAKSSFFSSNEPFLALNKPNLGILIVIFSVLCALAAKITARFWPGSVCAKTPEL